MPTVEKLVSQPDKTLLFMARRSGLRLTKRQRYHIRNPQTGQIEGQTPGEFIGFVEGVFRCPKAGKVTLTDTLNGGVCEVQAEELVSYLRKHRLFGDTQEGFWEVDPTAPPVSEDELGALMDAAMKLDTDTLRAIIEQEESGWQRDAILNRARQAVETIEQALAEKQDPAKPAAPKKA